MRKQKGTKPIPSLADARKRVGSHMGLSNAAYMRHEKSYTATPGRKRKAQSVSGGKKNKTMKY